MFKGIKSWFGRGNTKPVPTVDKVVSLNTQRDAIYKELDTLAAKEAALIQQGKQSKSMPAKKALAAQVHQLRLEMTRKNNLAGMLNKQIGIIHTDRHNSTIIQHSKDRPYASSDELLNNAVLAEEAIGVVEEMATLAQSLSTTVDQGTEIDTILREFEGPRVSEPVKYHEPPTYHEPVHHEPVHHEPVYHEPVYHEPIAESTHDFSYDGGGDCGGGDGGGSCCSSD